MRIRSRTARERYAGPHPVLGETVHQAACTRVRLCQLLCQLCQFLKEEMRTNLSHDEPRRKLV